MSEIARRLPTAICLIGVVVLMCLGKDGWGWLLIIAVLLS